MKWLKKVSTTPLTSIAKVIDSLQESTNDRVNAPSIRSVREAVSNNWLSIYPIGSIYMSVNNVDPSTVFGGTWQQIKDRFLLASGDTYSNGQTGGEATHTLVASEIPQHDHTFTYPEPYGQSDPGNTAKVVTNSVNDQTYKYTNNTTSKYGGGAAHNNMPPYLAVNVWVRTA